MHFFVEEWEYVALGPLDVSSYTCRIIKNIFAIIEYVGNTGDLSYITPYSICSVLTCVARELLFSSRAQEATHYLLIVINLTSIKEDGIIS